MAKPTIESNRTWCPECKTVVWAVCPDCEALSPLCDCVIDEEENN